MITESQRIRIVRAYLGMSVNDLAKRLGVTPSMVSNYQAGRYQPTGGNKAALEALLEEHQIVTLPSGYPIPLSDLMSVQKPQVRARTHSKEPQVA